MNPSQPWGQQAPAPVPQAQAPSTPWNPAPMPAQAHAGANTFSSPSAGFGGMGGANGFSHQNTGVPTGPPISLDPDSFTAGGMIDNVVVGFSECRVVMFDYNGKAAASAPCIVANLTILDANTGQPVQGTVPQAKYWTVGNADDFAPSADGTGIVPLGVKRGLNKASNAAIFIEKLIAAGFPRQVISTGRVDCMNGLVALVQNVVTPRAAGGAPMKNAQGGEQKDQTTLCVSRIFRLPAGMQAGPVTQTQPQAPAQAQVAQPQPQPQAPAQNLAQAFGQPVQGQSQYGGVPSQMSPGQVPFQAPMAQPQAAAQPTGIDPNVAADLLRRIVAANPPTRSAFNVMLFQAAMADEPMRNLIANPQFQASVLGAPVNLV